jgi:hypothetical protein
MMNTIELIGTMCAGISFIVILAILSPIWMFVEVYNFISKKPIAVLSILSVLLIPSVLSLKQCSTTYCNDFKIGQSMHSNSTTYINDMVINIGATTDKKGHLYRMTSSGIVSTAGTGGGGSAVTLYYDVLVDVKEQRVKKDQNVNAEITIINKGYVPDNDGILTTYLLSPNGTKYKEQIAQFELIPPTCEFGKYDWYEDTCLDSLGQNVSQPHKTIIDRELALPTDAQYGEWKFQVEYQTNVQPLIKVFDTFEVYITDYSLFILAAIAVFAYLKRGKKGTW